MPNNSKNKTKNKTFPKTVGLTDYELSFINAQCDKLEIGFSEMVRRMLDEYINNYQKELWRSIWRSNIYTLHDNINTTSKEDKP